MIKYYRKHIAHPAMRQIDLARKLRDAGLSQCWQKDISRWEHGLHVPDIDVLEYLADLIGVSIADLRVNIINSRRELTKIKKYDFETQQYKII